LLSTALRVTFLAPVILRGAVYCTGVAVRTCERRKRNSSPDPALADQTTPVSFRSAAQGYPEKQFRKTASR